MGAEVVKRIKMGCADLRVRAVRVTRLPRARAGRPALGVVDPGADVLTFRGMMVEYAEVRVLTRTIVPLPVLAPGLAALWVGLVTPIPNRLAVPLIEEVVTPVVGDTSRAATHVPEVRPMRYREAVAGT